MKLILAVGTGSFIGGICRYLLSQWIQTKAVSAFPFGTFTVNIAGCFLIGVVFALGEKEIITAEWRLFFATGIIGGFTTFSAFSNETFGLLRNGQLWIALIYSMASVVMGVCATYGGYSLFKIS